LSIGPRRNLSAGCYAAFRLTRVGPVVSGGAGRCRRRRDDFLCRGMLEAVPAGFEKGETRKVEMERYPKGIPAGGMNTRRDYDAAHSIHEAAGLGRRVTGFRWNGRIMAAPAVGRGMRCGRLLLRWSVEDWRISLSGEAALVDDWQAERGIGLRSVFFRRTARMRGLLPDVWTGRESGNGCRRRKSLFLVAGTTRERLEQRVIRLAEQKHQALCGVIPIREGPTYLQQCADSLHDTGGGKAEVKLENFVGVPQQGGITGPIHWGCTATFAVTATRTTFHRS